MRTPAVVLAAVLVCAAALAEDKTHVLPDDPKTPVIVLEYKGGFTSPRKSDEPSLQVLAGGGVILDDPLGIRKRVETTIPPERVQELLRYALDEQKLDQFDPQKIREEIESKQGRGLRPRVADAPTTEVRITADNRTIVASWYALDVDARRYPDVPGLVGLSNLQRKLEALRREIYAGGQEGIQKALALVNEALKAKYPDVPPLEERDLQSAWQMASGETVITFYRREDLGGLHNRFTNAKVTYDAAGKPKVEAGSAEVTRRNE